MPGESSAYKTARQRLVDNLKAKTPEQIIGVAVGCGISARSAQDAGADLLFAFSSGVYRQKGLASLAGYLPYASSNTLVLDLLEKELLPLRLHTPLIAGIHAADPVLNISNVMERLEHLGVAGVNNYPTISLVDGHFGQALRELEWSFSQEVELIARANSAGLFTVAFVTSPQQATQMVSAGADMICAHLGVTAGGHLGPRSVLPLISAAHLAKDILETCEKVSPQVLRTVYGGPVRSAAELAVLINSAPLQGYIGGSSFERTPYEEAIRSQIYDLKSADMPSGHSRIRQNSVDPVEFAKRYVAKNFGSDLSVKKICQLTHVSRSYFSTLFSQKVGCSYRDYVLNYRIQAACRLITQTAAQLNVIAKTVGYPDYATFSRIFKKKTGLSPSEYRTIQKNK